MKKCLKNLTLFTLVLIGILSLNSTIYADEALYSITIDGEKVNFTEELGYPYLTETERTMVPIRIISENMGYEVDWSKDTWDEGIKKVWIRNNDVEIEFEIGDSTVLVNGEEVPIDIQDGKPVDTKTELVGSRTYVPLRFVSETMGAEIEYQWKDGVHYIDIDTGKDEETIGTTDGAFEYDKWAENIAEEEGLTLDEYPDNGGFLLREYDEDGNFVSRPMNYIIERNSVAILLETGDNYEKNKALLKKVIEAGNAVKWEDIDKAINDHLTGDGIPKYTRVTFLNGVDGSVEISGDDETSMTIAIYFDFDPETGERY